MPIPMRHNVTSRHVTRHILPGLVLLLLAAVAFGGGDIPTQFTNRDSIANTRHNMTQSTMQNGQVTQMNVFRNDYGEVCVYCHTPHGANATAGAPLWNRTLPAGTSFTTYSTLNSATLTQTVTAPGANSLVCLSCHDGQTALDSVMNMPGSGRYSSNPNDAFLDTWQGSVFVGFHSPLGTMVALPPWGEAGTGCLSCHSPVGAFNENPYAADFRVASIGKDLTNDHPVGITFPTGNSDFNAPAAIQGGAKFFDLNGNGRMDKNEVRLYDTGDGFEVECASCHDPHGVPSGGAGSNFIPTFMRVANSNGSGLCLTCHVK